MRAIQGGLFLLALAVGQGAMADVTCNSLPDSLDPAIKRAAESVVSVRMQYVFEGKVVAETGGSGFVVGADGHVATARHLLNGFRRMLGEKGMRYEVVLADCRRHDAILIEQGESAGFVPETAVLKIVNSPKDLRPVSIGDATHLQPGDTVFAIGSPHGSNNTVVPGQVIARNVLLEELPFVPFIHASTPIEHGASGGVLVDGFGRAVGLTSMCSGVDTKMMGFICVKDGYFVPINLVMKFAQPFLARTQ